jgi:hypothetical protein
VGNINTNRKSNKIKNQVGQEYMEAIYGTPKIGDYYIASGGQGGVKKYVWNGKEWKDDMMVGPGVRDAMYESGTAWFTQEQLNEARNLHNTGKRYDKDGNIVKATDNKPLAVPNLEGVFDGNFEGGLEDGNFKVCRYPEDIVKEDTDYVMFNFYDYVPPFGAENQKNFLIGYDAATKKERQNMSLNQTLGAYNNSVTTAKKAEGYPSVLLYMPDDIQDAYSANWEGKAFGNIAAGIISAGGSKGTIAALGKIGGTLKDATDRLSVNTIASTITELAKSVTGDTITTGDVFGGTQGVVRNPNVEVLFQQMNLRTFDLSFKMSPYNKLDELHIQQMIRAFKRSMLPSYSIGKIFNQESEAIQAAFIKVPKLVQVAYMRGSGLHPFLPKYKLCALTDVNVNFTPDNNYATFNQAGGPVAYELKLNFMETKLVFSEEIASGNH